MRWTGNYLAVGQAGLHFIYHVKVSGRSASVKGITRADADYGGWWLSGSMLTSPSLEHKHSFIYTYDYPKGGEPVGMQSDGGKTIYGITVSVGSPIRAEHRAPRLAGWDE